MNTDSNKVLLVGIGETGLEVTQILGRNKVKGITTLGIDEESQLKLLYASKIQEAELVILVADLGSKKDDSLTLQAAKLAKENGRIVASFVTTPRIFEGEKKIMHALETAMELKSEVDASLIINKENFTNLPEDGYSPAELVDSLVLVEDRIAGAIQDMMALITTGGAINIDFEDLKSIIVQSGTFVIESGIGYKANRIRDAIEMALSSPMMKTCDIFTSRKVLIKVLPPKNSPISMDEVNILADFIGKFPPYVDVKWGEGTADDDDLLSVIILSSGFDVKLPEK
ncbi:MAG: hypothetical protein K2M69_05140 [Muribaculaceae bacterium]|nr:hypothetical protein [Muribaculaceae bacterium]